MEEDIVIGKNDKLEDIAHLAVSDRYQSIMTQVRAALANDSAKAEGTTAAQGGSLLHAEDDPTYKYVTRNITWSVTP